MLLINIEDVEPGMCVGAAVLHPQNPETEILKPGAPLTHVILERLKRFGITEMWVAHDLTRDLDQAVAPGLTQAKLRVYAKLRGGFSSTSSRCLDSVDLHHYRATIMNLVTELVAHEQTAGLVDQLFSASDDLFVHAANVAYLATFVGLGIDGYIKQERTTSSSHQSDHIVSIGLAGMLHDIGKAGLSDERAKARHEISGGEEKDEEYRRHPKLGHEMLPPNLVPATARHTVLNHHQRFDGKGWPKMPAAPDGRPRGPMEGRRIHIFTRIVSAANVLDNLLRDAEGARRPPVAALHDFASSAYDGWFDPVVRLAMLRRVSPFAVGTHVDLSDGRPAVVVTPNLQQPCRPTVRTLGRDEGDEPVVVPLSSNPKIRIKRYAGADVEQWLYTLPKQVKAKCA